MVATVQVIDRPLSAGVQLIRQKEESIPLSASVVMLKKEIVCLQQCGPGSLLCLALCCLCVSGLVMLDSSAWQWQRTGQSRRRWQQRWKLSQRQNLRESTPGSLLNKLAGSNTADPLRSQTTFLEVSRRSSGSRHEASGQVWTAAAGDCSNWRCQLFSHPKCLAGGIVLSLGGLPLPKVKWDLDQRAKTHFSLLWDSEETSFVCETKPQ